MSEDIDTVVAGEGNDGPGGGEAPDTVTEPVEAVEPEPVAEPVVEAKEPEVKSEPAKIEAKPAGRKSANQARLDELEAKIDDDAFDPFSKDGKSVIKEHARVVARVENEPTREVTVWTQLSEEHDMTVKELKQQWTETLKSMPEKFKGNEAAETYAFEQRIAGIKAARSQPKPKPAPNTGTPVIAKGQVLPRGAGSVPPQPKPVDNRTVEERVLAGDPETLKQFASAYSNYFKD